ncbi:hypothetical protein ASD04_17845 [Devosia sp. Root436]|nr:hypothetical protein ASD04_17845 [Devosia sp. Root436]
MLAGLAQIIGIEAVLTLAAARGGQRVYIPPAAMPDHWLTQLLGHDAARAVCDHFKLSVQGHRDHDVGWIGTPVVIPSAIRLRRRLLLEQACVKGFSIRETAIQLGISERMVSHMRAARNRRLGREQQHVGFMDKKGNDP